MLLPLCGRKASTKSTRPIFFKFSQNLRTLGQNRRTNSCFDNFKNQPRFLQKISTFKVVVFILKDRAAGPL